jgi:hypothetical protein
MEEALRFFRDYEIWIYLGLGALAIWQLRKFALAWDEMRGALFGMERESAQGRLNQAMMMLILLLVMAVSEFVLVTFVVPSFPGALPIPSPTIDLLATPTITLPPTTPADDIESTPVPTSEDESGEGNRCTPGQVEITSPEDGEEVSGEVVIIGTADIPNFGFYKYEIAHPGDSIWLPIQVGQDPKVDEELGTWDTSSLSPGDYMLQLVVTDNQGVSLSPCIVQVRVLSP